MHTLNIFFSNNTIRTCMYEDFVVAWRSEDHRRLKTAALYDFFLLSCSHEEVSSEM